MSRDGVIKLTFSEKMLIPDFLNTQPKSDKSRRLEDGVNLSELDVVRDLLDIDVVQNSDENTEGIGYYLTVVEWTHYSISIKFAFKNPMSVSKG
jgi:hypothetical protein